MVNNISIGDCFKTIDGHYYKQLEDYVLHVLFQSTEDIVINNLDNKWLDKIFFNEQLIAIDKSEFNQVVKKGIYYLELDEYWGD